MRASVLSWGHHRTGVPGPGYAQRLVAAAGDHVEASGADLGLFTCDTPPQPFYARAGWVLLPGTDLGGGTPDDPFASDQPGFDKVSFGGVFTERARSQRVDFIGPRIELYSGALDKLW